MTEPTTVPALAIKLLGGIVPGAVGAAIALRFNTSDLTRSRRIAAFGCSVGLAHYLGGAVVEHWALAGMVADAAKLGTGLFGLSIVAAMITEVPTIVAALRRRFIGESQ